MIKFICYTFIFIVCFSCEQGKDQKIELQSPNRKFVISVNPEEKLCYSIEYLDSAIIHPSLLGFQFYGDSLSNHDFSVSSVTREKVQSSWRPTYGERSEISENYNEILIELKPINPIQNRFDIRIRAYNEGIAFRYEFPANDEELIIEEELTEFALPINSKAWVSERAQSEIYNIPVSSIDIEAERPLLAELPNKIFISIGEAGLVDFARMKLKLKEGTTLKSSLGSSVEFDKPFVSPWRYIMAADKPGQLLENNFLLLTLNEPCKIQDVSWIRPGKVIREVTLTTQGGLACVDFAVNHNLQYVEFDAGWYGNEYDTLSDATTISVDPRRSKGPLDLHHVIKYAKNKKIGIILYVNRRALEQQLDEILPLYQKWGIAGVKYGFVNVGSQHWTGWLHEAVRKAAEHQLMVDIHDEYRPTGFSRTYPNLMTQEGIRGDEESPDNAMVLNTLFTRMLAGAGDHTNCYLATRVHEKMGSHASQMAKAICLYSPWQFLYWYDRPIGSPAKKGGAGGTEGFIQELAELQFYDAIPTVWDDTKVIAGYPGAYAVIARRSSERWFVGALNGADRRAMEIPLDFLDGEKSYTATIFYDDKFLNTRTKVAIKEIDVNVKTTFKRKVLEMNGLAMIINPK